MTRIKIGTKIYKYNKDGSNDVFRLKKINEENKLYSFLNEKTKEYIHITYEEIKENYNALTPDGYICVNIVTVGPFKDVVISLLRANDKNFANGIPYAVCRQGIYDYFTNNIKKKTQDITYVGMSISQDTCPKNVNFKVNLGCDNIDSTYTIAIYIDDCLDDILRFIPNKRKYDSTLSNLRIQAAKATPNFIGYNNTLEDLLKSNNFMYDYHSAFNILEVPFELSEDRDFLTEEEREKFVLLIKKDIINTYVIPYNKRIDLSKLQRKYVLAVNTNNPKNIYIIGYDEPELDRI